MVILITVKPRIQFQGLYIVYDEALNQHAVNISESLHEISVKAFKNWVSKANFHLISQSYLKKQVKILYRNTIRGFTVNILYYLLNIQYVFLSSTYL